MIIDDIYRTLKGVAMCGRGDCKECKVLYGGPFGNCPVIAAPREVIDRIAEKLRLEEALTPFVLSEDDIATLIAQECSE